MISDIGDWLEWLIPDRTVLAVLVYGNAAVAAYFAFREVQRSRTSQGSIAWLLSLALLPFPTTLIYLIFGLKAFDDYAALQTHAGRMFRTDRAKRAALFDYAATEQWPVLANVSQLPFLGGNAATLLVDGEQTFGSMFDGMRRAEKTIVAQFYIVRDDALGREFAEVLIERARAGVSVHLLYDDVGCFWLPRGYKQRLREAGVRVASFNQRHRYLRLYGPTRINYRNHRKVVVVDSHEAWVGGLNIGDEYIGRSTRFGRWRDTHVHVRGPAALGFLATFWEDWHWATGEDLQPPGQPGQPVGDQPVLVMPTGPADTLEDCSIAFTEVIASARERLWIVSPYFVPDIDMQTALYAAVLRGVEVRIMLPSKPDHQLVWLASNTYADSMVDHGVGIYRYQAGFLHQKVILVDDVIAGVGTVNFDNRSFRINFELTMWFTDREMVGAVRQMLEADFAECLKVDPADRHLRHPVVRLLGQAARLFSPIL